jgi:hypothetical protein
MDLKLSALGLVFVAGCASHVDWAKPGTAQEFVDADIKACRLAAESYPALPRLRTAPPSATGSSSTGTDLDADVQLQRAQRVESCMRERGYQLVTK